MSDDPRHPLTLAALLPLVFAAGCASVPDTGVPPVPITAAEVQASRSLPATPASRWPSDEWWKGYGDPQLAALIEEGLANSPDLAAAEARLRRAEAMSQVAGASLLPRINAEGSARGEKLSYNTGLPKAFLPQGWQDYGQLAASLDWDLDLWGRNRAGVAAARSEQQAAAIDLRQARLLLASTIALAYADFARLTEEAGIRMAARNLREASERLVAERVQGGLDMRGSLRLTEAQTATARAQLAATDEALVLRRNQIAALIGAGPDRGLAIAAPRWSSAIPQGLPDSVTTELIARRPDIAMARERVEAAASRVKVARADFYPAIRLSALYGLQSLGLDMLFKQDSTFGRAGGIVSLPIFHGGEISGRYRGARAEFDEAVADYDATVLGAYRQTADAAASRYALVERLADAQAAVAASEEAYDIALQRYRAGLSTYLDVLAVEDRLLQARAEANSVQALSRSADIALIRALGGGFAGPSDTEPEERPHG